MKCTQPGCTGSIVDGYCDVCGSPGRDVRHLRPRPAPPRPPRARSRRRSVSGPAAVVSPAAPAPSWTATATCAARPVTPPRLRRSAGAGSAGSSGGDEQRVGVHHDPRLQSARIGRDRLPAGRGWRHHGHQAGELRLPAAALGPPRCRVDPGTAGPVDRRGQGHHGQPGGAREQARLPQLRVAGRSRSGRSARAGRGLLPQVRQPVLLHPEAAARRPGREPVRGGGLPRPRRSGLDLPRQGQERLRPVGGAEGPAQHRRRRRPRGGHHREAVPGAGRAPADRGDLQLRHPRRSRLHRDGVRGRGLAQGHPEEPDAGGRGQLQPVAGGPVAGVHPRGAARLPVPARPRPGLLRLQARQPDPDRRRGQADRPRRRTAAGRRRVRHLRHRRLPGAGGARRSAPASPPTSTRSAARCWC